MKKVFLGISIVAIVAVGALLYWQSRQVSQPATEIVALQSSEGTEGFARVMQARPMKFPQDHGPHTDFQTEWWYYTGNLQAADGRRFGYQLTFFRRGITPGDISTLESASVAPGASTALTMTRASDWATNQIYFAHFAITDAQNNIHNESEIFSRGAAGLAGASGDPFHVWIENWSAQGLNQDASNVRLRADNGKMALDLNLNASKPPVVHGDKGVSQKTEQPGNASYYVSFTRMPTEGTVRINSGDREETLQVTGDSWFDHEWGTTGLGKNAAGWDWFSIQLDGSRELMFFQIRNKDGSIEPLSSGTLVEADGTSKFMKRDDVKITPLSDWTSPASGGKYPIKWQVQSDKGDLDLTLTPLISDQEMNVSFTYWEGAVNIEGLSQGRAVRGQGYVEMTGYAAQSGAAVGY